MVCLLCPRSRPIPRQIKNGLYRIVWRCQHCTETDDNTDSHWVLCTRSQYLSRSLAVRMDHQTLFVHNVCINKVRHYASDNACGHILCICPCVTLNRMVRQTSNISGNILISLFSQGEAGTSSRGGHRDGERRHRYVLTENRSVLMVIFYA